MTENSALIVCTSCAAINRSPIGNQLSKGKCGKCSAPLGAPKPIDITDKIYAKLQSRDQGPYVL